MTYLLLVRLLIGQRVLLISSVHTYSECFETRGSHRQIPVFYGNILTSCQNDAAVHLLTHCQNRTAGQVL